MELVQFYLHLPSNSSLDTFPNNTLTEYRVGLPQTASLAGDWEVGLTEIRYPHTCNNVQGNFQDLFYVRNQELSEVWEVLIIPLVFIVILFNHNMSGTHLFPCFELSQLKERMDNRSTNLSCIRNMYLSAESSSK